MSLEFTVDGLAMRQTDVKLVDDEDGETWWAYPHQKRSRELWQQTGEFSDAPESYIALNHAPTGAGKTCSWADPAYREFDNVLAMYPTKALINDQYDTLKTIFEEKYNAVVNEPFDENSNTDENNVSIGFARFTSDSYEKYRNKLEHTSSKNGQLFSDIIRRLDKTNDFVIALTNPDIFSYIRHDVYNGGISRRVSGLFDALIVDEFHQADIKGQHSLVFLLEQMRRETSKKSRTNKCMLLSATPEPEIQRKLESMEVPFIDLNKTNDTQNHTDSVNDTDWRTVLPPVSLQLRRGDTFNTGDYLISNEKAEDTREFCGREERTVIILDSLDEVERVAGRLDRWHGDTHIVQTLHGQTKDIGQKIRNFNNADAAILVTNSAGEIGIDYEADQLIFSGSTPSALLQRFGRLRNRTQTLNAIAYLPNRAYEAFNNVEDITENELMERETFKDIAKSGYKEVRRPKSFPPSFGAHEAYMQVKGIAEGSGPEDREQLIEDGFEMIENQFFEPYGLKFDKDEFKKRHKEVEGLLDSLKDFRSSSPTALIYNTNKNKVYTYNIEPVLRTGKIDVVEESEFYARIPDDLHDEARKLGGHTFGYIIYKGNEVREISKEQDEKPQPRNVSVAPAGQIWSMLSTDIEQRIPRRLDYFNYCVSNNDLTPIDIGPINKELQEKDASPIAYAIEGDGFTISSALGLDDFFFLSSVAGPEDSVSLALSHEALYLYCIKQENIYENNPTKNIRVHIPRSMKEKIIEGIGAAPPNRDPTEPPFPTMDNKA
jgi:CRISPR-associated endonuclease/helicase Cas3